MSNLLRSFIVIAALGACSPKSQEDTGSQEQSSRGFTQSGEASYYGPGFHGRQTANGERFDRNAMTAAHRTLNFGTRLCVTEVVSQNSIEVRINDRGPFVGHRIIDLSEGAMKALTGSQKGVTQVNIVALAPGETCGFAATGEKECKGTLQTSFESENSLSLSVSKKCPATKATVKLATAASESAKSETGIFKDVPGTSNKETIIDLSAFLDRDKYDVARIFLQKNAETYYTSNPSPKLPKADKLNSAQNPEQNPDRTPTLPTSGIEIESDFLDSDSI